MQYIYPFREGHRHMRDLLGGKGAGVAEMIRMGFPVPSGFTITTEVCCLFLEKNDYPDGFWEQFELRLKDLEDETGKILGNPKNPLLVSVRSGAEVSMPGMMDTVLNLGLNDATVKALIQKTKDERFSYDCYRRFIQMFGSVVMGLSHDEFEEELNALKKEKGIHENEDGSSNDSQLTAEHFAELIHRYKALIKAKTGKSFPDEPREQLRLAIEAVFLSWNNKRAKTYRKLHRITGLKGTAVTIQSMVFGNRGNTSGTGVAFTRNPANGERVLYGEFLENAQGEDVVAGLRTPRKIEELQKMMPEVYAELLDLQNRLEVHYKDMQDIEFTIEEGKLYLLQTRNGKRTAQAALKIAVDMVKEGILSENDAILHVDAGQLGSLLHPALDEKAAENAEIMAKGLSGSPGAACGKIVFTADDAVSWVEKGEKVILVRRETNPDDIHGMAVSQAILTSQGGVTSHAAVVCRGMGKCCVVGCHDVRINAKEKTLTCMGKGGKEYTLHEGDTITLNGTAGEVIFGAVKLVPPSLSEDFRTLMGWADKVRRLKVRTNADTPKDSKVALEFGAEGIGLCRTEHMFFGEERVRYMQEMIASPNKEHREKVLGELSTFQREDFMGIFEVMNGKPVTIRLLDPPLHEFLPHEEHQQREVAERMNMDIKKLRELVDSLEETNPMMGHRGCRLGITFPEIYEMQVRAILEAAIMVTNKGFKVLPEIEVPLIASAEELKWVKKSIDKVMAEFEKRITFEVKVGTMIEVPRACLKADTIADEADFMSFGTNDLTQLTFGYSRDDAGKFLPYYLEHGVLLGDPTESLDRSGVGELMKICVRLGRKAKPHIEIGICGEHGGDPSSIEFCHEIGLDYVSCSPFRVPIARLAAAQAVLKERKKMPDEEPKAVPVEQAAME